MQVFGLIAALATLLQASAPAGVEPAAKPSEVVVTAAAPKTRAAAITQFVQRLAAPAGQDNHLATWDYSVCPGVMGLDPAHAQYVNDKLATTALALGLKVGEPGCVPDILVVVTDDVAPLMQALTHHKSDLAAWYEDGVSGGSRRQTFDNFINTPRPVRWWHVSERVSADTKARIVGRVKVFTPTRLRSDTVEQFRSVLIVVDATKMQGIGYEALASYISMVALAQLDMEPPATSLSTIMTLFADRDAHRTPPATLTADDLAFLKGLYRSRGDAATASMQRRDIVEDMKTKPAH